MTTLNEHTSVLAASLSDARRFYQFRDANLVSVWQMEVGTDRFNETKLILVSVSTNQSRPLFTNKDVSHVTKAAGNEVFDRSQK